VKIERYQFGRITIDGHVYVNDIIIFPDRRIQDGWWRRHGHHMGVDDIAKLVVEAPEVIVAGTGAYGRMTVDETVENLLLEQQIELVAEPTAKAVELYNQMSVKQRVGACFHLTC
jgi:hypothetical protein